MLVVVTAAGQQRSIVGCKSGDRKVSKEPGIEGWEAEVG